MPEVHCEVNTSISLFLAGLLLKLGVYGILKFIFLLVFIVFVFSLLFVYGFCLFSLFNIFSLIFKCFDCKKIIGFSSILHLNLLLVSFNLLNSFSLLSGIITSISHGFCSVGLFLIVGLLINKIYSKYLDILFFINRLFLVVFICLLICNLSFPGTFNFIGEIIGFICIIEIDCFFCFLFLFILCSLSSFY